MSVPGLERGIAILRLFRRDRAMLGAPEIAADLGLPRSTAHRLLLSLVELGMLRRTDNGRFMLDAGVLTLGYEYLASADITDLAAPILERLRNDTNWSTHLAIRQGASIVYLSRYASRAAVTRNISVGTSLPAHATVMGRVLLSDLEPTELRALYADVPLPSGSPASPRDVGALEQMLLADRRRGHAASDGYYEPDVHVVAAPVHDATLKIVAAINATAVGAGAHDQAGVTQRVLAAARALSRLLGAPSAMPVLAQAMTGEDQR